MSQKLYSSFMIRTLSILLILFMTMGLKAQIFQRTYRFGPKLDYNSSKSEIPGSSQVTKTKEALLGLSGGYFVANNLELGLGLNYSSSKVEVGTVNQREYAFFVGPNLTYMIRLSDEFYVPITSAFGYKGTQSYNTFNKTFINGLALSGGIGIEYIVDEKVGVRLLLNSDFGSMDENNPYFVVDFNRFRIGIGANIYFQYWR